MDSDSKLIESLILPIDTTELDAIEYNLSQKNKRKLVNENKSDKKKKPKLKCHIEFCEYEVNHDYKLEAHCFNYHGVFSKFICLKCKDFKFQSTDTKRMIKHFKDHHNIEIDGKLNLSNNIYFEKNMFNESDNLILRNSYIQDKNTTAKYLDTEISVDFFDTYGAYNYEDCKKLLNKQEYIEKYLFSFKDFKSIIKVSNLITDCYNLASTSRAANDNYFDSASKDDYFNFLAISKGNIAHELESNEMNLGKFKLLKNRIFGYTSKNQLELKLAELNKKYKNGYYLIPLNSNIKKECCLFIHNCMIRIIKFGLENMTDTYFLHDNNFILDQNKFDPEKIVYLSIYLFVDFFMKFCEEINKLRDQIKKIKKENSIKGTFKIGDINQSVDSIVLPVDYMECD